MKKYTYKINIEAANEAEAVSKIDALTTLGSRLKTQELVRLSQIVKNDPATTALAKQYLGL